jgi:hypothetical protein
MDFHITATKEDGQKAMASILRAYETIILNETSCQRDRYSCYLDLNFHIKCKIKVLESYSREYDNT